MDQTVVSRWFRFYAEALDDPKVQKLDGDTFKAWVNLLCLTTKNGGVLPAIDDIAFALRIDANGARTLVERLLNATLIDKLNGGVNGCRYAPHGWHERQYKSDTSTERVKRFRQRSKTPDETAPDTESETEDSVDKSTGVAADPIKELFDVGVSVLTAVGHTERQARSLIGKWRKQSTDGQVLASLIDCRTKAISDPVAWMTKSLGGASGFVSPSGHIYRGEEKDVMRQAEQRADWNTYWSAKAALEKPRLN